MSGYGWNIEGCSPPPSASDPSDAQEAPPIGDCEWREAGLGQVPPGAVRAGVDKSGETVYVGRAFHEGDIVPAKIIPSHGGAYVAWGGAEHKKHDYSVLCCAQDRVGWVHGSGGDVPGNAVSIGRTGDGENLYVGRVFHDGTLTPGKIHRSHGCCYIPYNGEELSFLEYEVLVIH